MGWSYAKAAGDVMDKWISACLANSGSQNTWSTSKGKYFFETSRVEHGDGAITGTVWKFRPDGIHVRRSGTIRINGDGTIERAPKFLKDAAKS